MLDECANVSADVAVRDVDGRQSLEVGRQLAVFDFEDVYELVESTRHDEQSVAAGGESDVAGLITGFSVDFDG